jgi:hypothetical protein
VSRAGPGELQTDVQTLLWPGGPRSTVGSIHRRKALAVPDLLPTRVRRMDSGALSGDPTPGAQSWCVNGVFEGREGQDFKLALARAGASGHHWCSGQSRPGVMSGCGLGSNELMPTNRTNPIIPQGR